MKLSNKKSIRLFGRNLPTNVLRNFERRETYRKMVEIFPEEEKRQDEDIDNLLLEGPGVFPEPNTSEDPETRRKPSLPRLETSGLDANEKHEGEDTSRFKGSEEEDQNQPMSNNGNLDFSFDSPGKLQRTKRQCQLQMVQENSDAFEQTEDLRNKGERFLDKMFPPNSSSVFRSLKSPLENIVFSKEIKFKRVSELWGIGGITFNEEFKPTSFKSGSLSSSDVFLAAVSALAEAPETRLKRVIPKQKENLEGLYHFSINVKGTWLDVLVDDYVPVRKNKGKSWEPVFCSPNGKTVTERIPIWAMLYEKAWMKVAGNYENAQKSARLEDILRDLTGAPTKRIETNSKKENLDEKEKVWEILIDSGAKGHVVIVEMKGKQSSASKWKNDSRSRNHSEFLDKKTIEKENFDLLFFTILEAGLTGKEEKEQRLVLLRGYCGKWDKGTVDKDKEEAFLRESKSGKGSSWRALRSNQSLVDFDDLYKNSSAFYVCEIEEKWVHDSVSLKHLKGSYSIAKITLEDSKTSCIFESSQNDKLLYGEKLLETGFYDYAPIRMFLVSFDPTNEDYSFIDGVFTTSQRNSTLKCELEAGDYFLIVMADWSQSEPFDITLSFYGSQMPSFFAKEDLRSREFLLGEVLALYSIKNGQNAVCGTPNSRVSMHWAHEKTLGLWVYTFLNSSNSAKRITACSLSVENWEMEGSESDGSLEIAIEPKQMKVIFFKLKKDQKEQETEVKIGDIKVENMKE